MKRFVFAFFILVLYTVQINAQNTLTFSCNGFRDNDVLHMQQVDPTAIADVRESAIWDFSNLRKLGGPHDVKYRALENGRIGKIENPAFYIYETLNDTVLLLHYEDRLTRLTFSRPKLSIAFPLSFLDKIFFPYEGHGKYCDDYFINVMGNVAIEADAQGKMVLTEGDTLKHVLRVLTVTTSSIAMDADSCALDSVSRKQEIEEKYEWYVRGYRYPLFTTIQRTSYCNLQPVASKSFACRMLPVDLEIEDAVNDSVLVADSLSCINKTREAFHYCVNNSNGHVTVNYSLNSKATITAIITNIFGHMYYCTRRTEEEGNGYSIEFDCSNLPSGQYILHLNVNGIIYSEKVVL